MFEFVEWVVSNVQCCRFFPTNLIRLSCQLRIAPILPRESLIEGRIELLQTGDAVQVIC